MKIPDSIAAILISFLLTVLLAVSGWTLKAVVDIKVDVAALKAVVNQQHNTTAEK